MVVLTKKRLHGLRMVFIHSHMLTNNNGKGKKRSYRLALLSLVSPVPKASLQSTYLASILLQCIQQEGIKSIYSLVDSCHVMHTHYY